MNISIYAIPGLIITREQVEKAACIVFKISHTELYRKTRLKEYVMARQSVVWFLMEHMGYNDRKAVEGTPYDRTTAIHSVKTVNGYIEIKDKQFMPKFNPFMRMMGRK